MEFTIAIRENMGRERIRSRFCASSTQFGFGAHLPENITPSLFAMKWPPDAPLIPANINHPESEPMIIGRNFW